MAGFLDRLFGRSSAPQGSPGGPVFDQMVELGQWLPVKSSNVQAIRFRAKTDDKDLSKLAATGTLEVKFLAKGSSPSTVYAYYDIPLDTYISMKHAPSKGKFVWAYLRSWPKYKRIA